MLETRFRLTHAETPGPAVAFDNRYQSQAVASPPACATSFCNSSSGFRVEVAQNPFAVSSRENPQPLQPDGTLGTGKTLQPDGTLATEKSLLPDETLGTRKALQPDETLGTGKSRQPNTTVGAGECHGADDTLGKNGDQQANDGKK